MDLVCTQQRLTNVVLAITAVTSVHAAVTSRLSTAAGITSWSTDSSALAASATSLFGSDISLSFHGTTAAASASRSRLGVAAVTSIAAAVASSIWISAAAIDAGWGADSGRVAASAASLLGSDVSFLYIFSRESTAATRAARLRRLVRAASEV